MFPEEDNLRRELIGGELIVTAAPSTRHQEAVLELGARLLEHAKRRGGKVYVAPTDVFFTDRDVVEPDVLYVGPESVGRVERRFVRGPPDIVVEVSSPSSRLLELHRKRELYQVQGVPEYWFVDLESDRVEVYRLEEGGYGAPLVLTRGDALESPLLPGFSVQVEDVLGPLQS